MKSAVYSWRLRPETLLALEGLARAEGRRVSEVLDTLVADRLADAPDAPDDAVRTRAMVFAGTLHGGNPHRSERAAIVLRERLTRHRHHVRRAQGDR